MVLLLQEFGPCMPKFSFSDQLVFTTILFLDSDSEDMQVLEWINEVENELLVKEALGGDGGE